MHNDKKAYQVDRTPTELLSDLLVQLKFLRQECLHYDAGDWSYGAQIATKLRLLLHQTKYSDSLLAQITKRFAFSCPDFLSLSTVRGELPNKGRTDFVRSPLIQYQMIHHQLRHHSPARSPSGSDGAAPVSGTRKAICQTGIQDLVEWD